MLFRKCSLAAVLASGLAVAGCDPNAVVGQVQTETQNICSFVPTASTVLNILAPFAGQTATVAAVTRIASEICAAVTSKAARRGAVPMVRGVRIEGEFRRN